MEYKGNEWYSCVFSSREDRQAHTCEACGCHHGDVHPFTKNPVDLHAFVGGAPWSKKSDVYLCVCLDCLYLAGSYISEIKELAQGRLL
jgi:hypothetical protein